MPIDMDEKSVQKEEKTKNICITNINETELLN